MSWSLTPYGRRKVAHYFFQPYLQNCYLSSKHMWKMNSSLRKTFYMNALSDDCGVAGLLFELPDILFLKTLVHYFRLLDITFQTVSDASVISVIRPCSLLSLIRKCKHMWIQEEEGEQYVQSQNHKNLRLRLML